MKKQEKHIPYLAKMLEAFGGIGAGRLAMDNVFGKGKVKTSDYVDILNWATYAYNKMFPSIYLPQDIKEWNQDIDIILHGSPCQDFSLAGNSKGGEEDSGTRSSLLWEIFNIIENKLSKKPSVIIWENVKAVLNKNHRPTFDKYLKKLESLGYKNQWKVLNGVDYGIPQRRERVFVVSILPSDNRYNHFNIDNLEQVATAPLKDFLEDTKDLQYYIKQPSMIKALQRGKIKIIDNVVQTITTKQMRWNNAGVVKVPLTTFNQENYIFNTSIATLPTITASGANSRLKIAIPKFDKDLPVFVINDIPYHLRTITEREAWRLMGFKDTHYDKIKHLKKEVKYFLAGNSMIVQVMEAIFKELIKRSNND